MIALVVVAAFHSYLAVLDDEADVLAAAVGFQVLVGFVVVDDVLVVAIVDAAVVDIVVVVVVDAVVVDIVVVVDAVCC